LTPSQANYYLPFHLRSLIWQFARREVLAKYRGSLLGLGWSFLTPLLMLLVYTFVFREVFNARWPAADINAPDTNLSFALQVYAGMIVFNFFAEVMGRAPRLVLDQPNLVKKVVFPVEVLSWVAVLAAGFHFLVNLAVLLAAILLTSGSLPIALIALPLVVITFIPLLLGFAWFLASLGVFLRDIGQLIGMIMTALMFLSPIFYPAQAIPEKWRPLLTANPLTVPIEQFRGIVLEGLWPNWQTLSLYLLFGSIVCWMGAQWFRVTRKGFADVI
jgi:lipopolysaccharide transport system permease protein